VARSDGSLLIVAVHAARLDADGQVRPGINQAECLACHKTLEKTGFVFTFEALMAAAKAHPAP
jgi:hypothetical protein